MPSTPSISRNFFEDFRLGFPLSTSFELTRYMPRVDTAEDNKNIYITAELPGMAKDDVKVTLSDNVLTIQGKKERKTEETKKNFHRVERSFGSFARAFRLPATVDAEKITASYEDGVLKLEMPKREESKARRIQIGGTSKQIEAEVKKG